MNCWTPTLLIDCPGTVKHCPDLATPLILISYCNYCQCCDTSICWYIVAAVVYSESDMWENMGKGILEEPIGFLLYKVPLGILPPMLPWLPIATTSPNRTTPDKCITFFQCDNPYSDLTFSREALCSYPVGAAAPGLTHTPPSPLCLPTPPKQFTVI